jgi:hypothetical protein
MPQNERTSSRWAAVFALAVLCLVAFNWYRVGRLNRLITRPAPIEWTNDAVRDERRKSDEEAKAHPEVARLWLGHPEVYYTTPDGRQIEFGLRSDGVVVWRKR